MIRLWTGILLALIMFWAGAARAQDFGATHTKVTLQAEGISIAPGKPFLMALHMVPEAGWHTYWQNPGDSGLSTHIEWTLPDGFKAGEIRYPTPHKVPFGPLMNYGYGTANSLLVEITPPADLAQGTVIPIGATVNWLVCDDEICVPEDARFSLELAVASGAANGDYTILFADAKEALPIAAPWPVSYVREGGRFTLSLDLPAGAALVKEAWFYPHADGVILYAAKQTLSREGDRLLLSMDAGENLQGGLVTGVLSLKVDGSPHEQGFLISAGKGVVVQDMGFLLALGFAFLGGLILNLMPCVFPVLSLKALSLAKSGGDERHARQSGIYYTLGVLLSFGAIAAVLLGLRAAGAELGWGYQLQTPWVVALLALVIFTVGLNLMGLFEFGGRFVGIGDHLTHGQGRLPALATGVLAAVVATPCTAPFMATALGYAFTQSAPVAAMIFLTLGFGLALPFLLIAMVPSLRGWLPRPGAWMESFRQFLAFPMFFTALWLIWVVGIQRGLNGAVLVMGACGLIAFAVWAGRKWRIVGAGLLLMAFYSLTYLEEPQAAPEYEDFSVEKVAEFRAKGDGVFVYFTASWCITCKVNEHIALENDRVQAVFQDQDIRILRGDWTNRDGRITRELARHGRSGVPLYIFYPKGGGDAMILPQILTPDIVIGILTGEGK